MPRRYIPLPTPSAGPGGEIHIRCPDCGEITAVPMLRSRAMVCPWCDFHFPLEAGLHLELLVDEGSFRPVAQSPAGPSLFGHAALAKRPLAVALMDPASPWGTAEAQALIRVLEEARLARQPLLWVLSGTQEGVAEALWGGIQASLNQLRAEDRPWIALLAGPCYGAAAATALQADVLLAEPGAAVTAASPESLRLPPPPAQRPQDLLRAGWADTVLARQSQRAALADLLDLLTDEKRAARRAPSPPGQTRGQDSFRPLKEAQGLFGPLFELHGDRSGTDDPALVAGLTDLVEDGTRLLVLATARGPGWPGPSRRTGIIGAGGWRKATRLLRLAGRFHLPVVMLIDRPGLPTGRRKGHGELAAALGETLATLLSLPVPTIAVCLDERGALPERALLATDCVLATEQPAVRLRKAGIPLDETFAGREELAVRLIKHLRELTQTYAVQGPLGRRKLLQRRYARWTRVSPVDEITAPPEDDAQDRRP